MVYTERFNNWFDTYEGKYSGRGSASKNKKIKETLYNNWKKLKCDFYGYRCLAFQIMDYSIEFGVLKTIKQLQKVLGIRQTERMDERTVITANVQMRVYQRLIKLPI